MRGWFQFIALISLLLICTWGCTTDTNDDDDDDNDAGDDDGSDDDSASDDDGGDDDGGDDDTGGDPDIVVSPVQLEYLQVPLNTPVINGLSINNTGGAPLQVFGVVCSAPITTSCENFKGTVPPGGPAAHVAVEVTCTEVGVFGGQVVINSNDPDESPLNVPVHVECI